MTVEARKGALRRRLIAARAAVTPAEWRAGDSDRLRLLLDGPWLVGQKTVALYASCDDEPGTRGLIDALTARGVTVLLPVLTREIAWGVFDGWDSTRPGWRGIPVPTGPTLPPEALAEAGLIVVPCLAVGRDGTRLGTGGGWYDRALLHRAPGARLVALARDAELLDSVPVLPHDVRVHGYATERVSADASG